MQLNNSPPGGESRAGRKGNNGLRLTFWPSLWNGRGGQLWECNNIVHYEGHKMHSETFAVNSVTKEAVCSSEKAMDAKCIHMIKVVAPDRLYISSLPGVPVANPREDICHFSVGYRMDFFVSGRTLFVNPARVVERSDLDFEKRRGTIEVSVLLILTHVNLIWMERPKRRIRINESFEEVVSDDTKRLYSAPKLSFPNYIVNFISKNMLKCHQTPCERTNPSNPAPSSAPE